MSPTFLGLIYGTHTTRCDIDDAFCVLSRPITTHVPLAPSERKEGKGNLVLRSCWRVRKGQGSSRLSIATLQSVWMTYKLHANSVSQPDLWLLGLLHDPESTTGKPSANVTASNPSPVLGPLPALAALTAIIHLAEGPAPLGRNSAWNNEYAPHMPNNNELLDYLNGTVGSRADGPS